MLTLETHVYAECVQGVPQQGRCIWASDSELQIDLGAGATFEPDDQLRFVADAGLKTRNAVSDPTSASFTVTRPLVLVLPEILLWGTSTIDRCSFISVEDVASASRLRKNYTWTSSHVPLATAIRGIGGKSLDNLDSSLLPDDTEVTITAVSTDFLGGNSLPATFKILKKGLPAPKVLHILCSLCTLLVLSVRVRVLWIRSNDVHTVVHAYVLVTGAYSRLDTIRPYMFTWGKQANIYAYLLYCHHKDVPPQNAQHLPGCQLTYTCTHLVPHVSFLLPDVQVTFLPPKLLTTADKDVNIVASVQFSTCAGSSKSSINFAWKQEFFDGVKEPISSDFDLGAVSSSALYIPQYVLTAGKSYRLSLTISLSEDPGRYNQVVYDFSVGVLPLIAFIQGGNVIKVGSESDVLLDGSQSSDPNLKPSLEQGLAFTWSCMLAGDELSQACLDKNGNALLLPIGKIVTIPKDTLSPSPAEDSPYKFVLKVSKQGRCVHACVSCLCAHASVAPSMCSGKNAYSNVSMHTLYGISKE